MSSEYLTKDASLQLTEEWFIRPQHEGGDGLKASAKKNPLCYSQDDDEREREKRSQSVRESILGVAQSDVSRTSSPLGADNNPPMWMCGSSGSYLLLFSRLRAQVFLSVFGREGGLSGFFASRHLPKADTLEIFTKGWRSKFGKRDCHKARIIGMFSGNTFRPGFI